MEDRFRLRLCSDLDYEEMVVDVCYDDNFVAIISQENGPDKMEIMILPSRSETWNFPLDDFIATLIRAKKFLIGPQKGSNDSGIN